MKNLVLGMLLLFVTLSIKAQDKKSKNAKYNVEVNGNCEQCKKRIEKAAFSVSGVKSAEWHMDDHMLHLIINEEKCSVLDVEKAIAKIGHDTNNVKAEDEVYAKLHSCCLYERK
jgi:mercuric ion binding protein